MAGETIVAEVSGSPSNSQAVADAQLMATSPLLHDALQALVNGALNKFAPEVLSMSGLDEEIAVARRVLRHAEGE